MGMSASQARLLTLTSRLHDIEYRQQALSNTKMRLATESDAISQKYTNALNKQKFQFKNIQSNSYVNMTLKNLYAPGSNYTLRNAQGQMVVPKSIANNYKQMLNSQNNFYKNHYGQTAEQAGGKDSWTYWVVKDPSSMESKMLDNFKASFMLTQLYGISTYQGVFDKFKLEKSDYENKNGDQVLVDKCGANMNDITYYKNLYVQMYNESSKSGSGNNYTVSNNAVIVVDDSLLNDANWLYEAIESGQYMLCNASGVQVSAASETSVDEVNDDKDTARAKAEYDAETNKLNRKEKVIDNQMKTLDTEYSAVKTEFDSVKQIISDHASKDFELFG